MIEPAPSVMTAAMVQGPIPRWTSVGDGTWDELNLPIPKGRGYDTPEEAVAEAVKHGLKYDGNWKVHVMQGDEGGYFVVGMSQ